MYTNNVVKKKINVAKNNKGEQNEKTITQKAV